MFDLITYSFEKAISDAVRFEENEMPTDHAPQKLWVKMSSTESSRVWKSNTSLNPKNFVAVGYYYPNIGKKLTFAYWVPRRAWYVLKYMINCHNNLAILTNQMEDFTSNEQMDYRVQQYSWYMRQVLDFIETGLQYHWKHGIMTKSVIPFEMREYLEIFHRVGYHDRNLLSRIGYQDRHEVPWSEGLGRYSYSDRV